MAHLLLTVFSLLSLATSASASVLVGNDWRELPLGERQSYVIGIIDGWQVVDATIDAPAKRLPVGVFAKLTSCAVSRGMSGTQVFAIVEKYIADHPEKWHIGMATIVFVAMVAACK